MNWSSSLTSVSVKPVEHPTGPTVPVPCSVSGIFSLSFTEDLWWYIVAQTNLYAQQCIGEEKYTRWDKVIVEEMKAFYGFTILMGMVRLPSLYDYWRGDDYFHYAPIASCITRDQFFDLRRYLHFAENSTLAPPHTEGYNKLLMPLYRSVVPYIMYIEM